MSFGSKILIKDGIFLIIVVTMPVEFQAKAYYELLSD